MPDNDPYIFLNRTFSIASRMLGIKKTELDPQLKLMLQDARDMIWATATQIDKPRMGLWSKQVIASIILMWKLEKRRDEEHDKGNTSETDPLTQG